MALIDTPMVDAQTPVSSFSLTADRPCVVRGGEIFYFSARAFHFYYHIIASCSISESLSHRRRFWAWQLWRRECSKEANGPDTADTSFV